MPERVTFDLQQNQENLPCNVVCVGPEDGPEARAKAIRPCGRLAEGPSQLRSTGSKKDQIEKDAPQPQVVVALGLFTTKREPSKPSE